MEKKLTKNGNYYPFQLTDGGTVPKKGRKRAWRNG